MNTDNFTHDLPEGWAEANLQDLIGLDGVLTDGDWIETKDQDPQGNVRLIQLADIGDGFYRNRSQRFLTYETAQRLNCTFLKPGDVLVARMPEPLGRACIFPGDEKPAVTAVDVCIVRTGSPGVDHSWLVGVVNSPKMREEFERLQKGITRKRISKKNLISVKFPVPPYPEQRRIGAKIEELLDSVQKATNHLERVPAIIENFRKAVLNGACSGRLTEDWREKQPASKCTRTSSENNLLTEIEGFNFEIPKNWTIVSAEYVCNKITDGEHKTPKRKKEGRMLLSAKNIRSGYIDYENYDLISEDDFNRCLLRCNPEPGDVLIVSVGATIGRCAIVEKDTKFAIVRSVGLFKPNDLIRGKLLMYILQSPLLQKVIESVSHGTAQLCLYINKMKKLPIPLPPLEEQQETVRRVDRLFEFADKVEVRIKEAREKVVRLTHSILAKAFKGELVPTEAELARRQGRTYETAEQLLARIKLEREKKRTIELKGSEIKGRSKVMGVLRGLKKRPILEVLSEAKGKLKPEELFQKANFTEEFVDDFYEELREAVQAEQIKELRPNKKEIYLKAVKT